MENCSINSILYLTIASERNTTMTNTSSSDPINLLDRIDEILKQDIADRHSYYQMKHFILEKEYTTQGKMWQCLKEIRARKSSLVNIQMEIDSSKDNLELININKKKESMGIGSISGVNDPVSLLKIGESQVKVRQLTREAQRLTDSIWVLQAKMKNIEEETEFFAEQFEQFIKIEPLKPLDDQESQENFWHAKLASEVNLRVLLGAPLDVEIIRTILCLHDGCNLKRSVVKLLNESQKKLESKGNDGPTQHA